MRCGCVEAQVVASPLQSALYPFLTTCMLLLQPAEITCCSPEIGRAGLSLIEEALELYPFLILQNVSLSASTRYK